MASLSRKLKKYFKDEKPTQMENILTYLCRMNRHRISDAISSSESMYVVETSVIKSIQTHMAKNGRPLYKAYTIQMILVKQSALYPGKCIIRVDHDEWLNDRHEHVCNYFREYYKIDPNTLDVMYLEGMDFRE